MLKPNLFVIGAPKCGTTSLYHFFHEHNEIFVPELKEQHFFSQPEVLNTYYDVYFVSNKEEYLYNYKNVSNEKFICDISPSYLYYKNAAQRIYDFNKDAKVIVILRNPTDRAISHFLMDLRIGYVKNNFMNYLLDINTYNYREYVGNSMYSKNVKQYKKIFGDNLLILSFDELKTNPTMFFKKVYKFLGLEYKEHDFTIKHNVYSHSKNNFLYYLRRVRLYNALRFLIPRRFYSKIKLLFQTDKINKPDFIEERKFLDKLFEKEKETLYKITGEYLW